ncbi:MAG TPA: phosphoadenylyl-sulfate reductase [Chloroflexota bacterium]|nr:phosphoadenylyl-sulfate reductase [Chloroflexota bacterium]
MVIAEPPPKRVVFDDYEAGELAVELDDREPQEIMAWALETFGRRISICTSFQADGMAILDMATKIDPQVRVFTVDTGRLPQETYDFIEQVRQRYGLDIDIYLPDTREVEVMVRRHGANLFYQAVPLRLTCCDIRKVRPLRRALEDLDAWVTGLRRDQWASRANIRKVEIDHDHGGLLKVNPLADWTEEEVLEYLSANDVPVHPLYAKGYRTISCTPCTRPVAEGEDARSGRWWWEVNAPKECGMHCSIETGGFEHELEAVLGEAHSASSVSSS